MAGSSPSSIANASNGCPRPTNIQIASNLAITSANLNAIIAANPVDAIGTMLSTCLPLKSVASCDASAKAIITVAFANAPIPPLLSDCATYAPSNPAGTAFKHALQSNKGGPRGMGYGGGGGIEG